MKRPVSLTTSAALLCLLALAPVHAHARTPPNVLLIVSDDQGYQDLGCYGATDVKTPRLDRLAAEGARLTSFYVSWPACTPSRASLLTGRYPQRNGVYDMIRNDRVDDGHVYTPAEYAVSPERVLGADLREVFLSEALAEGGYVCGIFGKWDLGQLRRFLPLQQGFHEFYGFANTGIDYFTHERYGVASMLRGNEPTAADRGTYATDLFRREAVRFLRERGGKGKPFFLYVPFNAPHSASSLEAGVRGTVQAPRRFLDMYPEGKTAAAQKRRGYMAAVTCMDEAIGELLDVLDELNLADNTIVIFLSDNGGGGAARNAPLRGRKATMFEGGLRVPCIMRWPGKVAPGTASDALLTSLEIFPTVLAAAGVESPEGVVLDGHDVLPLLRGEAPARSPRTEMFWQRRDDRAARVGTWKWVDSAAGDGLFDLSADPGETRDRAAERPEVLEAVRARFAAWRAAVDAAEPRGPFRDF